MVAILLPPSRLCPAASGRRDGAASASLEGWHYAPVPRSVRAWFIVAPLATLGALGGHQLAYALTGTPREPLHGYLSHLPQVALLLALLSLAGAAFVERGARLALWPFPAVVLAGFVAQEHLERIAHTGSAPFLFDKPFFLVGLALQAFVALVAWLLARLLVRVVGAPAERKARTLPSIVELRPPVTAGPSGGSLAGVLRTRAPPFGR